MNKPIHQDPRVAEAMFLLTVMFEGCPFCLVVMGANEGDGTAISGNMPSRDQIEMLRGVVEQFDNGEAKPYSPLTTKNGKIH